MIMGVATRQLVREGEGRARQEINNIERQVCHKFSSFVCQGGFLLVEMYSAGVATGKHTLQRAGKIFHLHI